MTSNNTTNTVNATTIGSHNEVRITSKYQHHYQPFEHNGTNHNGHHNGAYHNNHNNHNNNHTYNNHPSNFGRNNYPKQKTKGIYCHNCGKYGHTSKKCRYPVLSYGIILFYPYNADKFISSDLFKNKINQQYITNEQDTQISSITGTNTADNVNTLETGGRPPPGLTKILPDHNIDPNKRQKITELELALQETIGNTETGSNKQNGENEFDLKYLMILDRHTPDYVQIILGNYDFEHTNYLKTLISRLTKTEIGLINTYDLNYLFVKYWIFSKKNALKLYKKQYLQSRKKFDLLKEGITNSKEEFVQFQELVEKYAHNGEGWDEPDWGFPKGRRKRPHYESDIDCAMREFKEETGIDQTQYHLMKNIKPIEEEFQGSNGVTYKHIYYLARAKTYLPIYLNPYNTLQISEIQKIGWYSYEHGIKMIRDYHSEKKSLFNKVHHYLKNNI